MSKSWVEKHRPDSWDSIQGNNKALEHIEEWAETWTLGDEPQLLVGPPGVGKTTTAHVASDTLGYPLNMINASEERKSAGLSRIVRSMKSSPIESDHQLVLLDEVDNFHHSVNKNDLYDALRNPRNPIILTANEEYDVPDPIKKASKTHKFKLGVRSRRAKIKEIAEREGVDLTKSEVKRLSNRPDLRSAINDLQTAAVSDVPVGKDQRTWAEGEFSAMSALLGGEREVWRDSVGYSDETFSGVDSAVLWADDNLSQEFRGLEAGVAYQMLATADYWAGKAWERQEFRFQKYAWALVAALPEARLSEPYDGWLDVSFPQWFRASEAKHDGSTDEAELFQALKGGEREFRMAGSFYEFRQRTLPLLKSMSTEKRMELALNHGLNQSAVKALDLKPDDFDDWREIEAPEEGDGWKPDSKSAADVGW